MFTSCRVCPESKTTLILSIFERRIEWKWNTFFEDFLMLMRKSLIVWIMENWHDAEKSAKDGRKSLTSEKPFGLE